MGRAKRHRVARRLAPKLRSYAAAKTEKSLSPSSKPATSFWFAPTIALPPMVSSSRARAASIRRRLPAKARRSTRRRRTNSPTSPRRPTSTVCSRARSMARARSISRWRGLPARARSRASSPWSPKPKRSVRQPGLHRQVERIFVPCVLLLVAVLLFAWVVVNEPFACFYRAMAVLVAASPCRSPSGAERGAERRARARVARSHQGGAPLETLGRVSSSL